jgi:hypothetical protein
MRVLLPVISVPEREARCRGQCGLSVVKICLEYDISLELMRAASDLLSLFAAS